MSSRKKIIIVSAICFTIIASWFFCTHSTYYKYNDNWIIGRHIDEVEKRYGKFDREYDGRMAKVYYIYTDNGPIMPSHLPMYYWMEYDENGIVVKVYVQGPAGG